jgi:glycosyltransferase involved in cell wall biosynthesis
MHKSHCFVFPSHSEGFGLTPLQSMSTGMPVIVSDNSGMSEYCNPSYNFPVPCYEVKVPDCRNGGFPDGWGDVGNWWNPHFDALVEAYRAVYADYGRAHKIGMDAAKWVRENWTVKHTCDKIIEVVKQDFEEG